MTSPRTLGAAEGDLENPTRDDDVLRQHSIPRRRGSHLSNNSVYTVYKEDETVAVGNLSPDPANAVASRCARTFIFVVLCQVVQMFMSYDGGATPASLDTIQEEMNYAWSQAEFGLLGSMDKIGMTATSMIWGRSLQLFPAKMLLAIGLILNTACTAAFGSLRSKGLMYGAKFFMGATQSLQGVWGTVWTVTMAPPERKTMWLGLGAVSSGLGNGIGTGVAGFTTANGLPYSFAFQLQAGFLALLWLCLMFIPAGHLRMSLPQKGFEDEAAPVLCADAGDAAVGGGRKVGCKEVMLCDRSKNGVKTKDQQPSTLAQLREAKNNKVYLWTALAISLAMFEVSGIQFLWVRVFVEVWGLDKNQVTLMFLLITGAGGGVGLAFGPAYIDRSGGFNTPKGVVKSLELLRYFVSLAATAGAAGAGFLYAKARLEDPGTLGVAYDPWLWLVWASIFCIWAAHNACVPALCGINVQAVPDSMRTFASGMEMTMRNILGYAAGPLLPGLAMDAVWSVMGWDIYADPSRTAYELKWQLCFGLGLVLALNIPGYFILGRASQAAKRSLEAKRAEALRELRAAFTTQEIEVLQRAVVRAKEVDLQETRDGESVLGMANQVIGSARAGALSFDGSSFFASMVSPEDLQRRIKELEKEVERLTVENKRLKAIADQPLPEQPLLESQASKDPGGGEAGAAYPAGGNGLDMKQRDDRAVTALGAGHAEVSQLIEDDDAEDV